MNKKQEVITTSAEKTKEFAKKILPLLLEKRIVALFGDLGSGKTTFVQGVMEALGVTQRIISPTFIIVRSYKIGIQNSELRIKNIYHIDLFRIETEKEVKDLGLREILQHPENLVLIEWAERMGKLLPKERVDIAFSYVEDEKRNIKVTIKK